MLTCILLVSVIPLKVYDGRGRNCNAFIMSYGLLRIDTYGYPLVAEVGYVSPMTKTSKVVFKLLIPIINGSRKEIGGISHAEM
jgi:hypothetical protein